ncbi:MAG TPA: flagellar motor protein [Burkholderiaceae bacterium]|jgi:chemotaxis protein MotA|nr:flagellar motor protein [Burkholderiaceae bacterium]
MMYMTIAGLIVAIVAIFSGQLLEGASLWTLAQPAAFLIVFGGTLGAVIAQSSPKDFMMAVRLLQWLPRPPMLDREEYIKEIVGWSRIAYHDGALKLDSLAMAIDDPLLKNGIEMIVDHYEPEYIRDTLVMDVRIRDARLRHAAKMWESAGAYAPTVGILGSVIGLLQVMNGLNDVSRLGAGIAAAFVATVYGLVLANLVFLPLAAKLRAIIFELTLRDELRIEGLTMIAQNKQPRLVERILVAAEERANNVVRIRRVA